MTKIPEELRQRPQWVLWRYVDGDKRPFQPNGQLARSNDPETWCGFEIACQHMADYVGVGYVFSADDPYTGVDLDGCRVNGKATDWARRWIEYFDSYTEVSPSGTGFKIFIRARNPRTAGKNIKLSEPRVCDKDPGVEWYDSKRFFCVTGQRLSGVSHAVESRQAELDVFAEYFDPTPVMRPPSRESLQANVLERARKYLSAIDPAISGQAGHNTTFRAACAMVLGFGLSKDDALSLLLEYNRRCQPPWTEKELEHKVTDAGKQPGERGYLRNKTLEEAVAYEMPTYQLPRKAELVSLQQAAMSYLEELEKGSPLIDLGIADLDYALGGGVAFGEMVVIAARPSHGKSAIALQCLDTATRNGMTAMMVSEEMSSLAIGKRAIQFASEVPEERWKTSRQEVERDLAFHFDRRSKCYVVENCRTPERVEAVIAEAVNDHGVKVVAVDYAQLLSGKGRSRYEQTSDTSVKLRQIASQYQIVLLVLAQLSRAIETRKEGFIPKLSDLKDSGQFEQDADVIVMLVWPYRLDTKSNPHEFQMFIAKNRNRAVNQWAITCRFIPSRQQFLHNLPQRVQEAENYQETFDVWNAGEDF